MSKQWQTVAYGGDTESPLWEQFHENSKLSRSSAAPSNRAIENVLVGLYDSLPCHSFPTVLLPKRLPALTMPVGKAMRSRVTTREMSPHSLRLNQVAALLHYGYGVTRDKRKSGLLRSLRVVPSAGALYPIEIFVHIRNVQHMPTGLFHYNPLKHHLRWLRDGIQNDEVARCFVPQTIPRHTSMVIFLTALFERSTFKYDNRGYRFTLLEAGHIAQNINLASSALKLGCKNIGGFYDREIDAFLQLDGISHSTVYVLAVGMKHPKSPARIPALKRGA